MSYYYPPINEKNLVVLIKLAKQHSDYFTSEDCPYGSAVAQLDFNSPPNTPSTFGDFELPEEDIGDLSDTSNLLAETQRLYRELQFMGKDMNKNTSSAERNTYFKLSATLLDKLIDMQERVVTVAGLARMQELMLQIMADEVTVDNRNNILDRLRKAATST